MDQIMSISKTHQNQGKWLSLYACLIQFPRLRMNVSIAEE